MTYDSSSWRHRKFAKKYNNRNSDVTNWVPAVICLSVQMFKLPNIWMFQTSAKSLPNLSCDFFAKIWKKSHHVQTGCFCPNLFSTLISPNILICTLDSHSFLIRVMGRQDRSNESCSAPYFEKDWAVKYNRAIFFVPILPK